MSLNIKKLIGAALIVLVIASAILAGRFAGTSMGAEAFEELRIFTEVLSVVKREYVEEADTKELVYGAIRGMLSSLDPHSGFMTKDAYKEMQVDTKGEFGGVGIQIGIRNDILTVIAPIEDTPAWKAGIAAGDRIMKINAESTKDMNLFDAVNKMRGKPGTEVVLSLFREGWKETKDFKIIRDIIKIKSVESKMINEDIGYVRIHQFTEQTAAEAQKAVTELEKKGMKSLVVDLRNNPGGLLKSAIDVAAHFAGEKKMVVYLKGRDGDRTDYPTGDGLHRTDIPMVVIVNQGSASASEILAGALKDWKRAVVVGVQTFGKGSVQSIIPLSDGSGLRLTTARYYTPNGVSIQSTGITPDIVVKLAPQNGQKEHPVMREKDLKGHLVNDKNAEPPAEPQVEPVEGEDEETAFFGDVKPEEDTQLQRAVDVLKTWEIFKGIADIETGAKTETKTEGK